MKTFYFHLGLPRAASTYLQKLVFPSLPGVHFFSKHQLKDFKGIYDGAGEGIYLFSHELFMDFEKTVRDITAHIPDARFIYVLRRQDSLAASRYKYYIRKFGYKNFSQFLESGNNNDFKEDNPEKVMTVRQDLYLKPKIDILNRYTTIPPLFLNYDDLLQHQSRFSASLYQYMNLNIPSEPWPGPRINRSFDNKQIKLIRRLNRRWPYHRPSKQDRPFYFKFRQMALLLTAGAANLLPDMLRHEQVIEDRELTKLMDAYDKDWAYALSFVHDPGS